MNEKAKLLSSDAKPRVYRIGFMTAGLPKSVHSNLLTYIPADFQFAPACYLQPCGLFPVLHFVLMLSVFYQLQLLNPGRNL